MKFKYLFMVIAMTLSTITVGAKVKLSEVYLYGFAATFNDSTVYFTEIQHLDSVGIDSKTKFLYHREDYSAQLQNYLESIGVPEATCITSFSTKSKKVNKKFMKMRQRYLKGNHYNIKNISTADFHYDKITPDASELNAEEVKPEKKAKKDKKAKERRPAPQGHGGPGAPGNGPGTPPMGAPGSHE